MTIYTEIDFSICVDCYEYAAGCGDNHAPQIDAHHSIALGYGVTMNKVTLIPGCGCGVEDDDHSEPHFSTRPCDWCQSRLGGDRFPAVLIVSEPEPEKVSA